MNRSAAAVRAAAEVIAEACQGRGWEREPQEIRDIFIERAMPVAERALQAADEQDLR